MVVLPCMIYYTAQLTRGKAANRLPSICYYMDRECKRRARLSQFHLNIERVKIVSILLCIHGSTIWTDRHTDRLTHKTRAFCEYIAYVQSVVANPCFTGKLLAFISKASCNAGVGYYWLHIRNILTKRSWMIYYTAQLTRGRAANRPLLYVIIWTANVNSVHVYLNFI